MNNQIDKEEYNPILIKIFDYKKHGLKFGLFQCKCGNEFEAYLYNLISGRTKSCGCMARKLTSIREKINKFFLS